MSKQQFNQEIVGRACMASQDSSKLPGEPGRVVGAYIVNEKLGDDRTATYPVFIVEMDDGSLMEPVYKWGLTLLPNGQPG